jgi:hypothetical protein
MKKWLDNFGKADNANESNVSLSEDFVGLGYDTKGRNYSPAWGGQFEDGGIIPVAQKGIQQDVTRLDNNAADRIWGIQRQIDSERLNSDEFREKYGMPLHQFKMRDSNYASAFQRQIEQRRQQDPNYAEVNLPSTDIRSTIYQGNPNLAFLPGTLEGQSRAALEDAFLATTTLSAPLFPVNTAKIGQASKLVGNYLTTQTPLQHTYKINPFAFKPDPKAYYRMGDGRKFIDDVLETNRIRAYNENSYANLRDAGKISGIRQDGKIVLKAKTFPEADTYWSKGVPLDGRYAPQKYGDYMIEASNDIPFIQAVNQKTKQKGFWDAPDVNYNNTHTKGNYVKPRQSYGYDIEGNIKPSIGTSLEYNPELIKLYEQDWLRGYKQIEIPKKEQGGSIPGSVGFTYARTAGSAPSEGKYAKKTLPSAQNGREMKFYQEGLDWKPRSMQDGGVERISTSDPRYAELYKNRQVGAFYDDAYTLPDLDEVVVTGQRPSLYQDLRGLTKTVGETAAEFTGIPGTIRFSQDPMENIKGLIRTGDQTGLGLVGLLPGVEQTGFNYNDQDLESAFNTLDAFGLASGVAGLARKPIQKGLQQTGKFLTTETPLKNAYKLNPSALKRDDVEFLYRWQADNVPSSLNMRLLDDKFTGRWYESKPTPQYMQIRPGSGQIQTAVVKKGTANIPEEVIRTAKESQASTERMLPDNVGFNIKRVEENPFDNVDVMDDDFRNVSIKARGLIESTNPKPHWLRGYEETLKPQQSFKSEIDWSKWNPETPTHKVLMDEYNAIEESTKKSGTWMKNPDGSVFQGTPEQFVQQQSSWFKKAFPEGHNTTYRGASNNQTFRGNLAKSDNPNIGAVFAGNKNSAVPKYGSFDRVIQPDELGKSYEGLPGYMELAYKPSDNSMKFSAKFSNWDNIDRSLLPSQHQKMNTVTQAAAQNNSIVTTDDIGRYIQDKNLDYASIDNIMDGTFFSNEIIYNHKPNNYLKSLRHNVGFFDMTNPNIYKGLVPAGIATGLSLDQKRDGGIIEDNRGQWDHPGEITQVNSNYITMGPDPKTGKKIKHDLIGISNTGDVQYMTPGNNYKFKGSKVTEIPVAELGINQLDAQPKKKLNQLLNFTNNPDKTNWLDNL